MQIKDNEVERMMIKEIEILQKLDHKNIIKYNGAFKLEDYYLILMEYADAGDLHGLIKEKKSKNE